MVVGEEQEQPFRASSFDESYWLGRCEGFLVETGERRVGIVESALFGTRVDRPDALIVRSGLLGRRLATVPVEEIVSISPGTKRILIRG